MRTQPKNRTAKAGIAAAALLAAAGMGVTSGIGAYWASNTDHGIIAGANLRFTVDTEQWQGTRQMVPGWTMSDSAEGTRTITLKNQTGVPVTIDLTSIITGSDNGQNVVGPDGSGFGHLFRNGFWIKAAIDTDSDGTPEATHAYPQADGQLPASQDLKDVRLEQDGEITIVVEAGFPETGSNAQVEYDRVWLNFKASLTHHWPGE